MADRIEFEIRGMDCAEEIFALKREVAPIVGGEQYLSFDLLNGRMIVQKPENTVDTARIFQTIARLGMKASFYSPSQESAQTTPPFFKKHIRAIFTCCSAFFILVAISLHAYLHRSLADALIAGDGGQIHEFPLLVVFFYLFAIIAGGWLVFPKALNAAKRRSPDMNLLMTIAVIGAVAIGEWLEAASVTFLFSLSLLLESWSVERARRATRALLEIAPQKARILLPNGDEEIVDAKSVSPETRFLVKPGERISLDGVIIKGETEINQAPITGESLPISKAPGDPVFAGTINGNSAIEVKCTKGAGDSTLARIIRMVSEAQEKRAPSEQWVEKFAHIYTPVVLGLAIAVFLIPPLFFSASWNEWLYRSLVLLVIACPCALVISTPVSIVAALTAAAKNGVLIKGGRYIELPIRIQAIAFDKTGTLTQGNLAVNEVIPMNHHSKEDLLRIAASMEVRSEHPIAQAIIASAKNTSLAFSPAEAYQTVPGKGATAFLNGKRYWLGSHRYMEEWHQETPDVHQTLKEFADRGFTVVTIGNETHVCGFITLRDSIRAESRQSIEALHQIGAKHIVMLTGDNKGTAELVGREVGVDAVYTELLPGDKVAKIEELVRDHQFVAMVGDGVNDAPAMARSSLAIAMGAAGSDVAIETADIALMSDDLSRLAWLMQHSKRTVEIIRQNIAFSLAVKLLFVGLTFTGRSSLWGAIAADTGASLLVVFNGLRLLRI